VPWPKGQPRKGYIKKDGTAHAPKGARMAQDNTIVVKGPRTQVSDNLPAANVAAPTGATLRIHGETSRPIIEPCLNCGYAYADGGYCPDCGRSKPVKIGRVA
jgi:hypothetical protein